MVFDISDVTGAVVALVGYNLGAGVRKDNTVRTGNYCAIAALGMRVVVLGFHILNFPVEAVRLWRLNEYTYLILLKFGGIE